MKKTYYDDFYIEKTIEVEENAKYVLRRLLFNRNIIGREIKEKLISQTMLLKIFQFEIKEDAITNFFSDKVGNVLKKIKKFNGFEKLTPSETLVFLCDFIMPIAYRRVELIQNELMYQGILEEGKFFWKSLRLDLKQKIYSIAYKKEYAEPICSDEELLRHEISKNNKLQNILTLCIHIEENFKALLEYKKEISRKMYGYCVRNLYLAQTHGVATELFHKVFDGLSRTDLMSENDFEVYNSLSDWILIFRGTDVDEEEPRPSWSLDINVARRFSRGKIMKANISKDRIMAYLDTDEQEILVWLKPEEVEILL